MTLTLGPSDLAALPVGSEFSMGGRVVYSDQSTVVLADALAQVRLETTPYLGASLRPGDLAVFRGVKTGAGVEIRSLKRVGAYPEPSALTEFGKRGLSERGRHLWARSRAKRAIHGYFEQQGFMEVDTPSAVPSPGLDAHVSSWAGLELRGRELYLITSPEFHMKRLLSAGLTKIYQICHCFRSEEEGPWHEPEFMMLEWYRAFADWEATIADTEEILRAVADAIADEETQRDLEAPFERITVADAFTTFGGVGDALDLASTNPDLFFEILVDHVEPALACFPRPVFLTHYPLCQAGLARPCADVPDTAERYELYFRGQELCNGFTELTDARLQRERFESELKRRAFADEILYPIDEAFLRALSEGMPPASGNAIGFDRLVSILLKNQSLEPVYAFTDAER